MLVEVRTECQELELQLIVSCPVRMLRILPEFPGSAASALNHGAMAIPNSVSLQIETQYITEAVFTLAFFLPASPST